MTPILEASNLTKRFDSNGRTVTAVHNVSFALAAGETLGLVGPSGSGKSTLARLVTRILEPDAGAVMLQGEDFLKLSGAPLRRRRRLLQMVFQDSSAAFNPRTTIKRALETPLRIHNLRPPNGRNDRVMELLQQVGLDPSLSTRSIHEISGGQRQRVAIARALACEPDVIVLDEALSGVDASRRIELVHLLQSLQQSTGVAYLFISHDLPLVRAVSHRVAIIDCGEIVECGRASDIIENPQSPTARALIAAAPRLEPFR